MKLLAKCLESLRFINPDLKEELAFVAAEVAFGLTIHQIAAWYVHAKSSNKPENHRPKNVNKKLERFIRTVLSLRNGNLALFILGAF